MNRIMTVYGSTGSGKSHYTKRALSGARRVLVFDTQDEYSEHGFRRCTSIAEVFEQAMADNWRDYRIAYVPHREADMVDELHYLSRALWSSQEVAGTMPATLVIEEANRGYPNERLPKDRRGVQALVLQGRHVNIRLVGISQRPANLNSDLRGNADRVVVFRLAEFIDRQAVGRMFGPEYIKKVSGLKDRENLVFERGILAANDN